MDAAKFLPSLGSGCCLSTEACWSEGSLPGPQLDFETIDQSIAHARRLCRLCPSCFSFILLTIAVKVSKEVLQHLNMTAALAEMCSAACKLQGIVATRLISICLYSVCCVLSISLAEYTMPSCAVCQLNEFAKLIIAVSRPATTVMTSQVNVVKRHS